MIKKHHFIVQQRSAALADILINSNKDSFFINNSAYFNSPGDFHITAEVKNITGIDLDKPKMPFDTFKVDIEVKITGTKEDIADWIDSSNIKIKTASFVLGGI